MPKIIRTTGTTVRVWGRFSDPDSREPLDPYTVQLTIYDPDATTTVFDYGSDIEIVRTEVGVYYFRLLLAEEGTYHWKWSATGEPGVSVVVLGDIDSVFSVDF